MSKVKLTFIVSLIIGNLFFSSQKVVAQVLTIDSILNAIERDHPELKMYDAQIKAYETYAKGAKSQDPPQVGAGLFMAPYNTQMWKSDAMTNSNGMGSFMISAQQMFMNPQKLNASSNYMKSMSGVETEMKNATRNEMFSMAKMSYYEWMIVKKKLKVLNESEALLNYLVKSTELRYTYGMDKLNAYYKAKGMLGDIQTMKVMVEQEIKQKMIELNTLMNRDKNIAFDIDSIYTIKDYEKGIADTSLIRASRSDLKAITQNMNVLKSKQLYERSKRFPDFGIKYDHMLAFGAQPQQFSLMAMVSIPIVPWSSKMYRASIGGLNYDIEALKEQESSFLNQVSGNIESLKVQIKSKKQQIEIYENTIVPSMKKNYEIALLAYEQNTEELFMVLDAWQNLKLMQLSYFDQIIELVTLQTEYEKQLEIK
jgi:outer membrane protein TolC